MSNNNSNNNQKNSSINTINTCLQETEDGEIEDVNTNISETISHDEEIENYYNTLKTVGTSLRCSCCGEVYSDPVKLQCGHLIDRYCVSSKLKSNGIKCSLCERDTYCSEIDDLLTDFDVAAQIPPKPNVIIEMINKRGGNSLGKRIKLEAGINNEADKNNEVSDDGEYEMVNGEKIKREKHQRRRKKTRWSAIDENRFDTKQAASGVVVVDPQVAFTGVISDILASHNQSKNITISQFKKYTEISNKTDIMNLLTEVVMQNTKSDSQNSERKSNPLSDKDILELIPSQELEDMFELEKIQLIMLYREALDKGVLIYPSQNKNTPPSNKQPLLPTPKRSNNGSVESHENTSPVSSRKRYTSESSKSSNLSYRSSNKSMLDSSDSESAGDTSYSRSHKKDKRQKSHTKQQQQQSSILISEHSISTKTSNMISTSDNLLSINEISQLPVTSTLNNTNTTNISSVTNENGHNKSISYSKSTTDDCQKSCDNIRYRDDINRLHALYSIMYHASLKMKEFEHKMDSEDYQNSYKTYCENYTEYQQLYSTLQSVINIDTINSDKPDSISNSYTGSDNATPVVNGIIVSVPVSSNQEQASSTISPACYAPDSTDFFNDPRRVKRQTNSELKANIQNNLSNYQQFKKENSVDTKKKIGYLWISNLSKEVRTGDLCRVFGKYGHISKVKLFQYKAQIPPTYFGLVFMPNYNEAENAIRQLQNKIMNDKQIHIKMLCPNSDSMNKTN